MFFTYKLPVGLCNIGHSATVDPKVNLDEGNKKLEDSTKKWVVVYKYN